MTMTNDDIISTFSKERQEEIHRMVVEELKRDYGIILNESLTDKDALNIINK